MPSVRPWCPQIAGIGRCLQERLRLWTHTEVPSGTMAGAVARREWCSTREMQRAILVSLPAAAHRNRVVPAEFGDVCCALIRALHWGHETWEDKVGAVHVPSAGVA